MPLRCSQTRKSVESPRHSSFVSEFGEHLKRVPIRLMCGFVFLLFAVDVAQVGQRTSTAPMIAGCAKGSKRAAVVFSGGVKIALFASDVALLVDRPCCPAVILNGFEDLRGFAQRVLRASIVA